MDRDDSQQRPSLADWFRAFFDARRRATLAMASSVGVVLYLGNGEKDTAALVACLVIATVEAVCFFVRRRRSDTEIASQLYVVALVLPAMLVLSLVTGFPSRRGGLTRAPWIDLRDRFATEAPAPTGDVRSGCTLHLVTPDHRMNTTYHRMVSVAFSDTHIHLRTSWPFSLFYGPVLIPADSVSACCASSWEWGSAPDRSATILWLQAAGVEVHFPDDDGHVREWCDQHEIPEGAPPLPWIGCRMAARPAVRK